MYIKKGGEPRASHMIEDNNNKYSNNDHNIENNNNKNVVNQSDPLTGHSAKKLKNRLPSRASGASSAVSIEARFMHSDGSTESRANSSKQPSRNSGWFSTVHAPALSGTRCVKSVTVRAITPRTPNTDFGSFVSTSSTRPRP